MQWVYINRYLHAGNGNRKNEAYANVSNFILFQLMLLRNRDVNRINNKCSPDYGREVESSLDHPFEYTEGSGLLSVVGFQFMNCNRVEQNNCGILAQARTTKVERLIESKYYESHWEGSDGLPVEDVHAEHEA